MKIFARFESIRLLMISTSDFYDIQFPMGFTVVASVILFVSFRFVISQDICYLDYSPIRHQT